MVILNYDVNHHDSISGSYRQKFEDNKIVNFTGLAQLHGDLFDFEMGKVNVTVIALQVKSKYIFLTKVI